MAASSFETAAAQPPQDEAEANLPLHPNPLPVRTGRGSALSARPNNDITMTDIPDNAARARQMYSEGATTRDILAETGLSHWGLYHWLAGGPKQKTASGCCRRCRSSGGGAP